MRSILLLLVLLVPAVVSAQVPCGVAAVQGRPNIPAQPAQPCLISATITPPTPNTAGSIRLDDPNQNYVSVPRGAQILWKVSGVGEYFLVAFDYDVAGSIFGDARKVFFKGSADSYSGAQVIAYSNINGVHYCIYAVDPSGNKYVLDPKVIVNSGGPTTLPR